MLAAITIEEAQVQLKEMIDKLGPGEEVVITKDQQPVAKLIATAKPTERKFGTLKGTVLYMAPDFNAPLEDFKEYVE